MNKKNLKLGNLFQSNKEPYTVLKTYYYDDRILALSNLRFKTTLVKNTNLKILSKGEIKWKQNR